MNRLPLSPPLLLPATGGLPVLLSIPHSGREYPPWLLHEARKGLPSLQPLEDPLVDRLAWKAIGLGLPAVIARAPRAAIDCNRSEDEIDPCTVSVPPGPDPGPRARGGLGLVPGRTPKDGELWRRKLSLSELERRKAEAWAPFHTAVADGLDAIKGRFGEVLLLDLHSMPPQGKRHSQLVFGDRHGRSCSRWLADLARRVAMDSGMRVAFNDPYAGGWIVEHHGKPADGIHALQVEIDRSCYLDAKLREPGSGFPAIAALLEELARRLGEAILDRDALPQAAE